MGRNTAKENMPPGTAARLAGFAWAANLLLLTGLVVLHLFGIGQLGGSTWSERLASVLLFASFACTGGFITTRQPANPIGWIFSGIVALYMISGYAEAYATYSLVLHPGALPGGIWAAWVTTWLSTIAFSIMLTFTFLLFPDGHFISPRWRWFGRFIVLIAVVQMVAKMLVPGPMTGFQNFNNPLRIDSAAPVLNWLVSNLPNLGGAVIAVSAASLLVRYHRARGIERLQIQWIALGAALPLATTFFFGFVVFGLINPKLGESGTLMDQVVNVVLAFSMLALPATTAIAILRYKLYNIEVILRRTLIYAALTACLSLIYFGSVVLLQQLSRWVWGGESPVAVVLSTLAIAAMFTPLRVRIQTIIDRRFYRRRYNTDQIMQDFNARLRDEVDLEQLKNQLLVTIEETIQPEEASIWIRQREEAHPRPIP